MVDVTQKPSSERRAIASGLIYLKPKTLRLILDGKIPKGDVFSVARIAGIAAAKKTWELIPLCHPLNITSISVDFFPEKKNKRIKIVSEVKVTGQTGVEMEALIAVSVASLTIYDMCKAVDKDMIISEIMLLEKYGGKSGTYKRKKDD